MKFNVKIPALTNHNYVVDAEDEHTAKKKALDGNFEKHTVGEILNQHTNCEGHEIEVTELTEEEQGNGDEKAAA